MKRSDYEIRHGLHGVSHYVPVWSTAMWPPPVCKTDNIAWSTLNPSVVLCLWCAQIRFTE